MEKFDYDKLKKIKWVYWGGPEISIEFLKECLDFDIKPELIISTTDSKVGRKQILTPPPIVQYAKKNNIPYIQPVTLKDNKGLVEKLKKYDLSMVVAYRKIIPEDILNAPDKNTLNFHPSLLPKYRGPSPIISAILDDEKNTGVSIILLDSQIDSGPVLIQMKIEIEQWVKNHKLEKNFARCGACLFLSILEDYLNGNIEHKIQNHDQITVCKKYLKEDMELKNGDDDYLKFRKYCAFPKAFFFKNDKRYIVTKAKFQDSKFIIEKVIPEGKKERDWKN